MVHCGPVPQRANGRPCVQAVCWLKLEHNVPSERHWRDGGMRVTGHAPYLHIMDNSSDVAGAFIWPIDGDHLVL